MNEVWRILREKDQSNSRIQRLVKGDKNWLYDNIGFQREKKKEKKYIDQSGHDANNNSLAKYERKLKMRRSIRFGTVGRWPCDQSFIIKSKMCVDWLCIFKKRTMLRIWVMLWTFFKKFFALLYYCGSLCLAVSFLRFSLSTTAGNINSVIIITYLEKE